MASSIPKAVEEKGEKRMGDEKKQTIWKGRAFEFQQEEVLLPNGRMTVVERVHHPGSVAMVPICEDGSIVLIRQYRPAVEDFVWEIPGGTLNPGESPLACAIRELHEECGWMGKHFEKLGEILIAPWCSDERTHLYIATDLVPSEPHLDEDEIITTHVVPLDQALAMIESGEIQDATTILVLQRLESMRKRTKSPPRRDFL
jgi:ADP-ribose pyrophosphatase